MFICSSIIVFSLLFINSSSAKVKRNDHLIESRVIENRTNQNGISNDTNDSESFNALPYRQVSTKLSGENIQYYNVGVLMASHLGKNRFFFCFFLFYAHLCQRNDFLFLCLCYLRQKLLP